MADQNHKVTIFVAVIGLIGTVGAGVVSNWDKIFGTSVTTIKTLQGESGTSSFAPNQPSRPLVELSPNLKPSFNCDKASTKAENLVCSSPDLAVLDLTLANAYRDAMAAVKQPYDRTQLKEDQMFWLREIRGRCVDVACLKNTYEARIRQLHEARW